MEVLTHGILQLLKPDILELLVGFAVLVTILVLAGLVFQKISSARDARRFPPPGQMVDVGGHRLHMCRTGKGSPTVVMDSGFPGTSLSWTFVQPEVAKFTSACSYDRAGLGWSDAGPMPRTSQQIVEELHALLLNARADGPYVLVGHSFGTFTVRLYASNYPAEVAGMVLVDPVHPNDWLQMTEAGRRKLTGAVRLSRYGALLARLGVARLISVLVGLGAPGLARYSVSMMTGGALAEAKRMIAPLAKLPLELRPIIAAFWTQPKFFEAMVRQAESLPRSAAQVSAAGDYGDIPLVVLSASSSSPSQTKGHEALAHLSSQGKHIVASKSGHWIQFDEPQLVVESIREVVESVRRQPRTTWSGRREGEREARRCAEAWDKRIL
jgi:pimeloyl-ACP methyl ester carboxylesterase